MVQPYIDKENAPATGAAARKGRLQSMGARPSKDSVNSTCRKSAQLQWSGYTVFNLAAITDINILFRIMLQEIV